MISISKLSKAFGARYIFRDADLQIGVRDRIALVGPNGSGKTTLIEMIAGEQHPDAGDISIAGGVVSGYLRQETDSLRGKTLLTEMMSARRDVTDAGHRLRILEDEIGQTTGHEHHRLVEEYGHIQDRYLVLGGYDLEHEAKKILGGLGFREQDFGSPTESLSGGWLMRLALSKLLLVGPDLLMLDEPTNHLDVESVEWLEKFLGAYEGAILLVSHDRDFINAIATRVVEIDQTKLTSYTGNFEKFIEQRELIALQLEAAAKNQARKVAATQEFIDRFRYKASKARQVQSRIKSLDKMERISAPARRHKAMKVTFPQPPRPGRVVMELKDINFAYENSLVYENLNLIIERGQKIALVGPNGAGKTTLLKLLAGALVPQAGTRDLGHNVDCGYYAQHQIEALTPSNRVVDELQLAVPPHLNLNPRTVLGRFLFTGDDAHKRVSVLSGGERSKLALAKLLVSPHNILCMDEPTNHLDMVSRDALEDALTEYTGCLVLITHDRHLIRGIANRIVEVVEGRVTEFNGDYDYYLDRRSEQRAIGPSKHPTAEKTKERRRAEAQVRAGTKVLRDKVSRLERQMAGLSTEIERLTEQMSSPTFYSECEDIGAFMKRFDSLRQHLEGLEIRWEEVATLLESSKEPAGS